MAINPALLIAAPFLQEVLVDNATGLPMADGVITLYQDNSRTTLKNWYYQTGSPGSYTYLPLDNPLTLSSAGSITDPNGNDTIPFFYPYSETDNTTPQAYYITVVDANGQSQFTRQNFPFIAGGGSTPPFNQTPTYENYIINNNFWRNIGSLNAQNVTQQIIAPSQHDGFIASDIQYIKNTTGAIETISFSKFTPGQTLVGDIVPEYYINHSCTGLQTGETQKVYQFPISLHVKTLDSVSGTITIQAQNTAGNSNNTLEIFIYQFLGTGVTSPAPFLIQTITLTNAWQKYLIPFTTPPASASLGAGGDDALYLQIGMPLSAVFNISFTLPSFYLSSNVPTNNFSTYDQVGSIIDTPRTGDIRTSINSFYPFGWVAMNNGTIGNASSNATARANQDTWQLFSLIWNYSLAYDSGSTSNPISQLVNSSGTPINYGASAYADFSANNALTLTKTFGNVIAGSVPVSALLPQYNKTITASNSGGNLLITVSSITGFSNNQPIVFTTTGTLPGNIFAKSVYFITNISGNTFNVATSFANSLSGTKISFSSSGSNSSVVGNIPGINYGQATHVQLESELAAHNHPGSVISPGAFVGITTSSGGANYLQAIGSTFLNIATDGSSLPFNIVQPTTFYNVFMKL